MVKSGKFAVMRIYIVAAMAENRVIGDGQYISWDLPDDRRRFREITWGHPVIMGRKTFESLPGPLPGRKNIVLTRDPGYRPAGCSVAHDPASALRLAGNCGQVFICGGEEVYREFLPQADGIFLTLVHGDFAGAASFPEIPPDFTVTACEQVQAPIPHTFFVYARKPENSP